jgi:type I restriction enzyme, S subunit
MVDSELGEIPEGWRVGKLGEVVNICGGGTPPTENPEFWNGEIYWTSPKDLGLNKGLFLFDTEKKITEKGLKKISSGLLPIGTLLLSSRAPVGYLAISEIQLAINQGYIAFSPDGYLSNFFMYLWLKYNMGLVIAAANGSTFLEISKKNFKEIEIVIIDTKKLESFDKVIKPIFRKIKDNSEQIQSLIRSRDELLPRLMKGGRRVSNLIY